MDIVKIEGLSKAYSNGIVEVKALNNVSFNIKEGEFVAIIGASGSGKSTLLHLLGGLDRPTDGKVIVDNKAIYSLSEKELSVFRRRKIGFIFQFYNLIPVLSAEENIVLPILLDNKKVDKEYVDELINFLGLKDRIKHFPNELSGGQQQRVSIARALATKPSIILADEPTGNLDSKTGKEVLDLIRLSVKKYHQTLVMITHDPSIAATADRVIQIQDGIIVNDKVMRA